MKNTLTLKPGEMFFLYTDGVTEALNSNAALFGEGRLQQSLNAVQDPGPVRCVQQVRSDVAAYVQDAEQSDDITMVAVKYYGPQ